MNAVAPRLTPDKGRIYFYRSVMLGLTIQPEIRLNNETVGRAIPGGFFFVDRPRGNYEASTTTEVETKLAFPLRGGETKYILVVAHMQFELVDESVAEAELASLNNV